MLGWQSFNRTANFCIVACPDVRLEFLMSFEPCQKGALIKLKREDNTRVDE
jgi:hypothetical protein